MSFELTKEYLEGIRVAIKNNDEEWIRGQMDDLYPPDIAEIIDQVNLDEAQIIFKLLLF